ncbi:MAG: hypothetical protein M5R36_04430 [Deltaproteobacteria bacterium]|nr:hypothetical protein [Deltaproteobacteria bacterium]
MSPKVPRRILLKAKRFLAKINIRSATTAIDGGPLPDLKRKLRDGLNDPEARFLLIDLVTSCERAEIKARPDARFASGCADVADDLSAVLEKDTSVLRRPPKYRALLVAASLLIWLLVPVGMTAPRSVNSLPDRIYAMSPEQVASYFSVRFGPRTALAADDDSAVDDDTATDDDTTPDDDTATDGDTTADDDTTFDDDSADDDSVNEFDATLDIISPGFLEPDSEYDFDISVANTTVAGDVRRWINDVELYLPTVDYQVDETSLAAPDALHPGDGEWSADFTDNEMFIGLRWLLRIRCRRRRTATFTKAKASTSRFEPQRTPTRRMDSAGTSKRTTASSSRATNLSEVVRAMTTTITTTTAINAITALRAPKSQSMTTTMDAAGAAEGCSA